jgi:multidrug efflux pump subunit AcrA (membrane-fusion protein)
MTTMRAIQASRANTGSRDGIARAAPAGVGAMRPRALRSTAVVVLLGALALTRAGDAQPAPTAPAVTVDTVTVQDVAPVSTYVGHVEAIQSVQVMARVTAYLEKVDFTEGGELKAGQILFELENAPYTAAVQAAKAQATYLQADTEYQRQARLNQQGFAPQATLDQARATRDSDAADVEAAKANLTTTAINLGYTKILSPLDGRIGKALFSVGTLLTPASAALATVEQMEPIRVVFAVPDRDVVQEHVFRVIVQDSADFRQRIDDIDRLYVRSTAGALVPLRSVVTVTTIQGPDAVTRYNLYPAVLINGQATPGVSSGQAIAAMQQVAAQRLPSGYGYEWTGMTYQELQSAGQECAAFILALVFSYLFLVAQYESWTVPLSVFLPVSTAVLRALAALWLRRTPLDVYGQVGLVMLMGLAAKNAILIAEFARTRVLAGEDPLNAAEGGARTRYRPVIMTAVAFIIGMLPLVFATAAGAAARRSIGTTVFGGMLLATLLGTLFVPMLFVGIQRLVQRIGKRRPLREA